MLLVEVVLVNAQVQVWLAPVPIHSCVGAIANRGQWDQGCSLLMATDLGPVRATRKNKNKKNMPQVGLEPGSLSDDLLEFDHTL